MTKLRRRKIEDMQLHGYSPKTQQCYVGAVKDLAKTPPTITGLVGRRGDSQVFPLPDQREKGIAQQRHHSLVGDQVFL